MKIRLLVVATLCLSVSGCKCGKQIVVTPPDYVPNPVALNFEACPTKDETGKPVVDVFPDEKMLKIANQSKSGGGLKLTFVGDGAAVFSTDLKRADPMDPTGIGSLSNLSLPILFTPTKKGVVTAQLVISDETDDTPDRKVDLVGTGSDLGAQPTIKVSVLDVSNAYKDCLTGLVCEQNFADTLFKEAVTLEVKVTNTGCPALKITGLEITPQAGGNPAYFIDSPSVLPTAMTPLILTQSGGLQTTKFKIRFAPEDDGSGNLTRFATLRIKTNDPNALDSDGNKGGFDLQLSGSALKPSIYTTPTRCDFSDPADLCGNATKITGKANFLVKNEGNVAFKIDSTTFKSNGSETAGQDNRLTVTGTPLKGVLILAGGSAPLQISHTEMPLYIQDLVTISASLLLPDGGTSISGSAGRAVLSLSGGKKPCMSTIPAIDLASGQARLDFAAPTTELSAKEVTIKNGPVGMCGDLIISSVAVVDAPNPFFSLLDPMILAGTKIPPGTELKVTVQYKKPVSGGTQVGSLRISSNDGDFATPPGYIVQLYSQSPLDQVPVAVIKACVDVACTMPKSSVSLGMLRAGPNGTRLVTVSGKDSYDPQPDGGFEKPLPLYRFRLVSAPSNATEHKLPGDGLKDAGTDVEFTLDGAATGVYKISLDVWDRANQQSGNSALLQLTVFQ